MNRIQRPAAVCAALLALLATQPAGAQQQVSRSIPVGNARIVRVNVSGDVQLTPSENATEVTIKGDAPVGSPPLDVRSSRTGERLNLSLSGPERSVLPFAASGHAYSVTYPARLGIDVREFAGGVAIAHARAPVTIYNANGAISVVDAASSVTVEADNGDISATGIRSSIDATAGTGNLSATLAAGWSGREVRLESSNGNISLTVPRGFRGRFDVTSGDGRVRNDLASDPHAPLVFVLTEHGNIAVTRENL